MAGILGIGSGIDIDSIIKVLVDSEKAPKTNQLDKLEKSTSARISAVGTLRGALGEFQTALGNLNKASLFESRTASLSSSSNLTATAATDAVAGKYSLQVSQLATGSKVGLKSFDQSSAPVKFSEGTLKLSAGDPTQSDVAKLDIEINASNNTLTGIRDAINEQGASKGFSASIVTDASGSRLVISSSNMGDGNNIRVNVDDGTAIPDSEALSALAFNQDGSAATAPSSSTGEAGVITKAQSAKLSVDGLQVTRNNNVIEGVIDGVKLTLTSAQSQADLDAGKTIDLTVGVDKGSVKSNLQKFVDAYNKLYNTTATLTSVVKVGEDKPPATGPLLGDATVRGLQTSLRSAMSELQGGDAIRALADLGISTQKDGTLKLDDTKLDKALAANFDQVADYLTGDKGLLGRLDKIVSGYTRTDGVLDQRNKGLQATITNVDEQRKALDLRVAKIQERLVAQYTAMDQLVARLQKTSEGLTNQLANLPGFVKKS